MVAYNVFQAISLIMFRSRDLPEKRRFVYVWKGGGDFVLWYPLKRNWRTRRSLIGISCAIGGKGRVAKFSERVEV